MRITRLRIPDGLFEFGLGDSTLARLGEVVVLAGRNGSGKSRLLNAVASLVATHKSAAVIRESRAQAGRQADSARALQKQIDSARISPKERADRRRKLASVLAGERSLTARADALEAIEYLGEWPPNAAIHLVPRATAFDDYRSTPLRDLDRAAGQAREIGSQSLVSSTLPYIREVQARAGAAGDPLASIDEELRTHLVGQLETLSEMIALLLGERLGRGEDGEPTLFGFPLYDRRLSPGQAVLLQIAVALHAQGAVMDGLVLLLDEPESHLHPEALVHVLDRLRTYIGAGQIWIATHSVHVLAWAPQDAIWYVDNGRALWAGREPERVLTGLLGSQERRTSLEAFLQLPAQMAANRFAAECLSPPAVVTTAPTDRQLSQVRLAVERLHTDVRPFRVLDFGAGQARLLPALRLNFPDSTVFARRIDYRSYDSSIMHGELRRGVIAEAYGATDASTRDFSRIDLLESSIDANSVDVVVMCNVLHEIDPADWIRVFGLVSRLLRRDGFVLVVEDQQIPIGERAHKYGFLLLDAPHLARLFGWSESQPVVQSVEPGTDRLKAHLVPAALLTNISETTRVAALRMLRETAKFEIGRVRDAEPSARNGTLHGLWVQLLANAVIALDVFDNDRGLI